MIKVNTEKLVPQYRVWIQEQLDECTNIISNLNIENDYELEALYRISHQIKGTSCSFGYTLLSEIGGLLCIYLSQTCRLDINESIIRELVDAMYIIHDNDIKGLGGEIGKDILNHLMIVALE